MYSENQRNTCARRANDEFLRRMLGGELAGNGDMNTSCGNRGGCGGRDQRSNGCGQRSIADRRGNCAGASVRTTENGASCSLCGRRNHMQSPFFERSDAPACNSGDTMQNGNTCHHGGKGVSLAMVYSPIQGFQNLYEPCVALKNGTLFAELNLPFEGCGGKEGCARR